MNEALKNIMDIHASIEDIESFIKIKGRIESLDTNSESYKEFLRYTFKIANVLKAFGEIE